MNIVIIEDELLTAEDLAQIIGQIGKDIHISAVLHSIKDSIDYFRQGPLVDLVFSDIQLGDGLSFEIFRAVRVETPIIFCTAYDEYALDAFKSNGIDYILKPFTAGTVIQAIGRYQQLKKHFMPASLDYEKLIKTIRGEDRPEHPVVSILVYHRDKVL